MPGGHSSLSANEDKDGMIWTLFPQGDGQWEPQQGTLVAFDALTFTSRRKKFYLFIAANDAYLKLRSPPSPRRVKTFPQAAGAAASSELEAECSKSPSWSWRLPC
jgi:hypothetical protein